jgi:hypothetical protein
MPIPTRGALILLAMTAPMILLAMTAPMLWSRLLFQIFAKPILNIDAALVSIILAAYAEAEVRVVPCTLTPQLSDRIRRFTDAVSTRTRF